MSNMAEDWKEKPNKTRAIHEQASVWLSGVNGSNERRLYTQRSSSPLGHLFISLSRLSLGFIDFQSTFMIWSITFQLFVRANETEDDVVTHESANMSMFSMLAPCHSMQRAFAPLFFPFPLNFHVQLTYKVNGSFFLHNVEKREIKGETAFRSEIEKLICDFRSNCLFAPLMGEL